MIGWRRAARVCLWLVCSIGPAPAAAAQVGGGTLTGDVVDQAGAAVPGATVTPPAIDTNVARVSITGADGHYTVPALTPGAYQVRIEVSGFRPLTRDGILI